jgi:hypothetical protein
MRRPTSFTVFGILNLLFGVFGLFGVMSSAAMIFLPQTATRYNPWLEIYFRNPTLVLYWKCSLVWGSLFSVILIFSGIGLLAFRPWGRILAIAYAFFGIVSSMVSFAVNYFYIMPMVLEKISMLPDSLQKSGMLGGVTGIYIGAGVGIFYPLILFFFMSRDSVFEALRMRGAPDLPKFSSMYSS